MGGATGTRFTAFGAAVSGPVSVGCFTGLSQMTVRAWRWRAHARVSGMDWDRQGEVRSNQGATAALSGRSVGGVVLCGGEGPSNPLGAVAISRRRRLVGGQCEPTWDDANDVGGQGAFRRGKVTRVEMCGLWYAHHDTTVLLQHYDGASDYIVRE